MNLFFTALAVFIALMIFLFLLRIVLVLCIRLWLYIKCQKPYEQLMVQIMQVEFPEEEQVPNPLPEDFTLGDLFDNLRIAQAAFAWVESLPWPDKLWQEYLLWDKCLQNGANSEDDNSSENGANSEDEEVLVKK